MGVGIRSMDEIIPGRMSFQLRYETHNRLIRIRPSFAQNEFLSLGPAAEKACIP